MEILTVGSHYIYIGVAVDSLKNTTSSYSHVDSLTIRFDNGNTYLASSGKTLAVPLFQLRDGYRIQVAVDRIANEVKWTLSCPVHQ